MQHDEWEDEYPDEDVQYVDKPGPFRTQCAFCRGTGVDPATMGLLAHETCSVCSGKGTQDFTGDRSSYTPCAKCTGSGKEPQSQPVKPCSVCRGFGIV